MRTTYIKFAFLSLLFLYGCGCNGCGNKEKQTKNVTIKLVLETSASMAGFLNGNTEFKDKVTNFFSIIEKLKAQKKMLYEDKCNKYFINKIEFCSLDEKSIATTFSNDALDINNAILTGSLATGKSSPLDKIFLNLVKEHKDKDSVIRIIISDLSYSFSDEEVKKNREINRENLATVKNVFGNIFNQVVMDSNSFALYAFKSSFNGNFFTYKNDKIPGHHSVPFYISFIGNENLLSNFLKGLERENFKGQEDLYISTSIKNKYEILGYTNKRNAITKKDDGKSYLAYKERTKGDIEFVVVMDGISYKNVDNYMQENLEIISNKGDKAEFELFPLNKVNKEDEEKLQNFANPSLIKIKIRKPSEDVKYTIKLKDKLPNWINDWTISNFNSLSTNTFGLKEILTGIHNSYKKEYLRNFTISIIKE